MNEPTKRLVYRVTPDPNGAFDYLIVGSAEEAGRAAAEGAFFSIDAGDDPPDVFSIDCMYMDPDEFDNLPEL